MIALKKLLHFFGLLFGKFHFQEQQMGIAIQVMRNMDVFANKIKNPMIEEIKVFINKHDWTLLQINTLEEYVFKVEAYGFQINGLNSELFNILDRKFEPIQANFSQFVHLIAQGCTNLVQKLAILTKGNLDTDNSLVEQVDDFINKIMDYLYKHVRNSGFELISLACVANDLDYIQG